MLHARVLRGLWWRCRTATLYLRGGLLCLKVRALGGRCSWRITVDKGAWFKHPPHEGITIEAGVSIGRDVMIDVPPGGTLYLGRTVKLTMAVVISAVERVTLGDQTQVAEFCSIRDADHGVARGVPMMEQAMVSAPVTIGSDVWLARGVVVLKGASIGDGAVVGANSVVRGTVPPGAIVVGAPAKPVKYR